MDIPDGVRPLSEWFRECDSRFVVAWDRDIPADYRWVTDDDGCLCEPPQTHFPYVFVGVRAGDEKSWRLFPFVTDGHGSGFEWIEDARDPLGGRWKNTSVLRVDGELVEVWSSYRIVEGDPNVELLVPLARAGDGL